MSDLVERLTYQANHIDPNDDKRPNGDLMMEGAEEIVRLRSELDQAHRKALEMHARAKTAEGWQKSYRDVIADHKKALAEEQARTAALRASLATARREGYRDGLEAAAKVAGHEVDVYTEGVSAIDVRLSFTRSPKWRDGPAIAAAIRAIPSDDGGA